MQNFLTQLFARFSTDEISTIQNQFGFFILITPKNKNGNKILIATGLSEFQMNVHEKHIGEEFNELYFYLPSYWDLNDTENTSMNWVFIWLEKLKKHVISKNSWFGNGHTIATGKSLVPLSDKMLQNHFILAHPMELSKELASIKLEDKTIHFLAVIPIFEDEMDYKQGKGTAKLFKKFEQANVTEKLDEFRKTVLRNRWNFFGK
ncbi:MAG: suppressor of fused domain protein [Crocinitomicaceae bacterium]|jgi:hypothetical protein